MAVGAADRVIANRYALKSDLGPRELGTVWHAQDTLLGREVVVREIVFPPWLAGAERRAAQASLLREAGAVARLNHPGVVTLFDVVTDDHGIFIVTELVQAPSLAELVLPAGPLPPRRVAEIGAEVASVLEVAHGDGIVHRGVKPANVMVRHDGRVRLAGFGVTSGPAPREVPDPSGVAGLTERQSAVVLTAATDGGLPTGPLHAITSQILRRAR